MIDLAAYLNTPCIPEAVREFVTRSHKNLIGGEWRDASGGARLDVYEPSSGQVMCSVPSAAVGDAKAAVAAARAAFDDKRWRGMLPGEREKILLRLADLVDAHFDELCVLESLDVGKPLAWTKIIDVPEVSRYTRYMAGFCTRLDGRTTRTSIPGDLFTYTLEQPVGVVAGIIPWNFPLVMSAWKIVAPLAAGCSVVLKPAENTPLSAIRLVELCLEAGVPEGVVNIVTGLGSTAGAALVSDPRVNKVTFTGSVPTGKSIGRAAMDNVTRVTLELGGKSPVIVMPDADLEQAAKGVADAIFFNTGQNCVAGSRLFAHKDVYDRLIADVAAIADKMALAPGLDPSCELGPLVSEDHMAKVLSYLDKGREEGAELVCGGAREGDAGYFVRPTVFSNATADMAIMREEIFGPVLSAQPFEDEASVIEAANATEFGLAASIWTQNLRTAHRLIPEIDAGTVWVNVHNLIDAPIPFGGFKHSGFGRENGPDNLAAYLETKSVWINYGDQ